MPNAVPIATVIAIVVAYVIVAVLLLSMNLTSRWRWWIKGAAIVVTGIFFGYSYFAVLSVLGWPTNDELPPRFSLLASRVVEPDKILGTPGSVYFWLEELDEDNVPNGRPRSYRLPYTSELAGSAEKAQAMLEDGQSVEGGIQIRPEEGQDVVTSEGGTTADQRAGTAYEAPPEQQLTFTDLPPVKLPDKAIL